jgi:hypothetical protein
MQRLHDSLTRKNGGHAAIVSNALHGLGGIGKTRAAVEYAWAHSDDYSAVLFVLAASPEALWLDLAALVGTLGLPQREPMDEAMRLRAVLDWLRTNPGWLLILDNVDTKATLVEAGQLMGQLAGGHVVLTSRLDVFAAHVEPLEMDVLTLEDATSFLLERTAPRRRAAAHDAAKARELAEELGRLALALEHAGAYIATRRIGFGQYLDIWRSNREKVIGWADPATTGYPRAVAETWQASMDQLTETGHHLLERLAFLAPDPVPEFLLDVVIPDVEAEDQHDALVNLAAYSLVTRDGEMLQFSVHRLVQDVTRR